MDIKDAYKRLSKEYIAMQKEPPPFVWAVPDEKDILIWNFIIHGPPESPYVGGEYHGALIFTSEYPFQPPGIKMYTPSGRFQPDKKICFSMSDFHPRSWNPAWTVDMILIGLVSFMNSDEMTIGSMATSDADKRVYASQSHAWNLQQRRFREAFPDYCTPSRRPLPNMGEKERGIPDTPEPKPETCESITPTTCLPVIPPPKVGQVGVPSVVRPRKGHVVSTIGTGDGSRGWAATWRQVVWDRWRWGVLIALAVVVSRITTTT